MIRQLVLAMLLSGSLCATAQNVKRPDSYNYTRGIEAYNNNNPDEAIEYFNKEIKEHPDNGYTYVWIAGIWKYKEQYGAALSAINTAIKKLPNKDKEFKSYAYGIRASVYLCLEDTTNAIKDYSQAIALQPGISQYYWERAQIYFEKREFSLAYNDYEKMIALDEGDVMGYMGKGRNLIEEKKYSEAIPVFDHVIKLSSDYSSGYSFRSDCYIGLKQYSKALDDVIKALSIDYDNKAFYNMQTIADSAYNETVSKFKVQKIKEPNENKWDYSLGVIHERHEAYAKAIESYKASLAKDASDVTAYRIGNCYDELGDYAHAIEYFDMAIQMDSTDTDNMMAKASSLDNAGNAKEAISVIDQVLASHPDYGFAYYKRGWIKENSKDIEGALEDYTMCISLSPEDAYTYFCRGRIYDQKGDKQKAKADYEKAIELDKKGKDADVSFYCYYHLGEKDKAIEALNKSLELDNKGNYYDAACLYSIMGETDTAISYLRKSLEKGFRRFAHIERDDDMDNIRELDAFKKLIVEYKQKYAQELQDENQEDSVYEEKVVEVPFTKEGGVYKVKCTINGLPLHFIFDTGASNVSISNVEANFMLKNDYLQKGDFGGTQYYQTANGEISEGTVITLRNITFGGLTLDNVKASVVKAQSAPLLLGQSVLGRLGKIEIDNANRVLKITHKEKKIQ